jgi:YVTN family beta-propeller protein
MNAEQPDPPRPMRDRRLEWPGRRRGLPRVALLFCVTLGAYWPIWLAQVVPSSGEGARARRGAVALAAAAVVPVLNVVLEVALALFLPRRLRRLAESRPGAPPAETEALTFLVLAAPFVAIALAIAIGLPFWLVGYIAWPLELPATLLVQRVLNRLEPAGRSPAPTRDGELFASGAVALSLVVAAVLVLALGGGGKSGRAAPANTSQEAKASDIAATPRSLWVTRIEDDAIVEIDGTSLRPTGRRVPVGRSPYDIAYGFGDLWVADYRSDSVTRVDPRTARVKGARIPTGRGPFGVAIGFGHVWVTNEVDRNVVEIDPRTSRVVRKITVGLGPRGVATGLGAVWVAGAGSASVVRVDPHTEATRRITMPDFCQDVAVGGGRVWAVIPQANSVVRIDPVTGSRASGLIAVRVAPTSVEYGGGSIWVANAGDGTVSRISARTGRVVGKARLVAGRLADLTVSGGYLYVLRVDGTVRRISIT